MEALFGPSKLPPRRYIKQIADKDSSIYSCELTSRLNGLISRRRLTPKEALAVQQRTLEEPDRFYRYREDLGVKTLWLFPKGTEELIEEVTSKKVRFDVWRAGVDNIPHLATFLRQVLHYPSSVVFGEGTHARLVVGEKQVQDQFRLVDPRKPRTISYTNPAAMARIILHGSEQYVTLIR
jgi:hypothetical protein